jgi:hypothetical protein
MTQIGEGISPPAFFADDSHSDKTCPWCKKENPPPSQPAMLAPSPETDGPMAANSGGKLRSNLNKSGDKEVKDREFTLKFEAAHKINYRDGGKDKKMQTYRETTIEKGPYKLQYAPHHLIPGNESLAGNPLVAYLGDDDVIKEFSDGVASKIKKDQSANYDVNRAENGVWLPSPYALSMSNKWPTLPGLKVLAEQNDLSAQSTEEFKHAYVDAAIANSSKHQFHMRHTDYSREVEQVLEKLAKRLAKAPFTNCPEAKKDADSDKLDAPLGLPEKLDQISTSLKGLLTGPVWRAPYYADDNLMSEYITRKKLEKSTEKFNSPSI